MTIEDKIYNELQNIIIDNCSLCYMPTTKKDLEYHKKLYDLEVCEQCVINAIIKIFCKGVLI